MRIIFDLKNGTTKWCERVNSTITDECPSYLRENHIIGSNEWWKLYESNGIDKKIRSGEITFLGERTDWSNHLMNIVEINCNGELVEFEVCSNWDVSHFSVGKIFEIEEFSVSFMGKYGPYEFGFIKRVSIKST